MTTARRDFPQLDAMRAAASIAVVVTHVGFWSGFYTSGFLGVLVQRLEAGVAVFFVLSGFLLCRPYLVAAHDRAPHDPARVYFQKRFFRIVPVYVVTVVAAMTLLAENRSMGVLRWVQNLLMVDLYRETQLPQGLTQMWSLTIEVAFYLILPLLGAVLVKVVCRDRWRPVRLLVFVAGLIVLSVAWVAATHVMDASWAPWAAKWLPSYLSWFALGIGLAVLTVDSGAPGRLTSWLSTLGQDRVACWTSAAAILVFVSTPLGGSPLLIAPTPSQAIMRHVCYAAIALLLIAPCVLGTDDSPVARAMSLPAVRHLGHISYALFCCHVIVLAIAVPRLGFTVFDSNPVVLFVVIMGISLAVSELLYRFVEVPGMALRPRLQPTPAATAPSEAAAQS
ncbi:acyltransferase family protein [Aeromicrobium sp. S22]|uniref:acyltransferase family protein n=1 Tax=Aeromicrobium sp. S22 TaxID=2662029 RepID=UPI00129D5735|nr:acyltransferase [Aeromicrobium sp. S22]MRK02100.1 acyltransferase family protein [Aeromicrobium sp. S22]